LGTLALGVSPVFTEETKEEQAEAQLGQGRQSLSGTRKPSATTGKLERSLKPSPVTTVKAGKQTCCKGVRKTYPRPISELVLIVESQDRADVN